MYLAPRRRARHRPPARCPARTSYSGDPKDNAAGGSAEGASPPARRPHAADSSDVTETAGLLRERAEQQRDHFDQRRHVVKAALYALQNFYAFMLMWVSLFSLPPLSAPPLAPRRGASARAATNLGARPSGLRPMLQACVHDVQWLGHGRCHDWRFRRISHVWREQLSHQGHGLPLG